MHTSRALCWFVLAVLVTTLSVAQEQQQAGRQSYSSAGFNFSSVSGVGLSFRHHFPSASLLQFGAGIISSGDRTNSALGLEYQYELSKKETFRYYLTVGGGIYSGSTSSTAAGIGVGLELPMLGEKIYESVTGGLALFYPVAYSEDQRSNISFGASLYFFYNF